jgi:hypothetical protein
MEMAEVYIMRNLIICRLHCIIIRCKVTWENKSNRTFNLYEGEDISPQDFGEVV